MYLFLIFFILRELYVPLFLLSVLTWCAAQMFAERSVKGTQSVEADSLAYLCHCLVGIYQHLTRRRDSQRVDVVIKAYIQLVAHNM